MSPKRSEIGPNAPQERQVESISSSEQSKGISTNCNYPPPPPSSRAKPDKPSGLMNVISISDNHKPPTPTVYTDIHTVGLVGNCREQGHSKSPSPRQRLSDIASIRMAVSREKPHRQEPYFPFQVNYGFLNGIAA